MKNEHTPQSTPQGTEPYATKGLGSLPVGQNSTINFQEDTYSVHTRNTSETGATGINLKALGLIALAVVGAVVATNWGAISNAVTGLLGK